MGMPDRQHVHPFEDRLRRALQDPDLCLLFNKRRGFWQVAVFTHNCRNLPVKLAGAELCEDPLKPVPFWWVGDCMKPRSVRMAAGGLDIPGMDKAGSKAFEPINPGEWMVKPLYDISQRTRGDIEREDVRYDGKAFFNFLQDRNEELDQQIEEAEREAYWSETEAEAPHFLAGRRIFYG